MIFDEPGAVQHIGAQLGLVELRLQRAAIVVVAGITAERRQAIRRQREKTIHREPARDVLDVRVEPAVLVNHQHRRPGSVALRVHQVAAHLFAVPAGRRIRHVARLDARVGEGDGLSPGIVRKQSLRHHQRRRAQRTRAPHEFAAVDAAVAILVVEIEYLLVDFGLGNCGHRSSGRGMSEMLTPSPRISSRIFAVSSPLLTWNLLSST